MAAVGNLLVRIGADTGGLRRGGRQSQRTMQGMARQARSTANRMAKIGAAATAAAAAITGKLVAAQLQAIDKTAKLADQIGTSTEAITGLQHAAEITGPGAEKMAAGLEVLSKRVGEAAQGSGQAGDAIEQLGLSVEELDSMSPDQQFNAIADAMQGMESQSQKNAIAADLFSRSNQELVNTLQMGSEGVNALRQEAADLGVAFNRVEAAKVEQANDAMTRVRQVITGVVRNLTIELAPIIQGIADRFTTAASEAGGMGSVVQSAVDGAVRIVGVFADGLHGLRIAFAGLKVIAAGFGAAFWSVIQGLARGLANLSSMVNGVINDAIRAFNRIPGLSDIQLLQEDPGEFPFVKRLDSIGERARENLGDARTAMHDLAMQELPSAGIDRWVDEVRAGSQEAAEAAAKAKKRIAATAGGGDDAGGDEETAQQRERMREELELMRAKLEGERAMQERHYTQQLEQLRKYRENELITKQEFDELKAQAEAKHEQKITDIKEAEEKRRQDLSKRSWDIQRNAATGALSDITSALGKENDKQTKIQKAAAVARAVMTGWEAAVNAWNAGMSVGGPWAPAVAAAYTAASLAKTGAQINAIRSGSSTGGGGSGAGAAGTTGAGASAQGQQQEQRREATINVQGDSFGGDTIGRLAEEMGEFLTDGGRLGRVNVNRS